MNKELIKTVRAVAFDLDGTIYYGNQIINGALNLIEFLNEKNIRVFYFTNNSTSTREQIYTKLTRLGLKLSLKEVYTSAYAAAVYARLNELSDVYCVGANGLIDELKAMQIKVVTQIDNAQNIVIGLDKQFTYEKLADLLAISQTKDCQIIACNADLHYPVENGRLMPGCGVILAALEAMTGKKIDYMVGKPNIFMMELLLKDFGLSKDEIMVVGDSYSSDIQMAKNIGCRSVLFTPSITNVLDTFEVSHLSDIKSLFD